MPKLMRSLILALALVSAAAAAPAPQPPIAKPVPGAPGVSRPAMVTRARALNAAVTCVQGLASSLTVTLTVTPPTTNADGSPLILPITGYNIYQGTASGGEVKVGSVTGTTDTISTGLVPGTTYYFQETALDANGEGTRSNEVCKSFPASTAPPGAPGLGIS